MNDSPYNLLPGYIKRKFEIVYSELLVDNITMFKNKHEKWGVLIHRFKFGLIPSYDYLVEPIYNGVGFNKTLNLIAAHLYENNVFHQDKNIAIYYDLNGAIVWQSIKGESILRIDEYGNIFLKRDNKIGLLNKSFTQIIAPKYERLDSINSTLLKAFLNGKFGIINFSDETILDFSFDEIFRTILNNKVIVRNEETYSTFNIENYSLTQLPFSKILNPSSNTYKAPSSESFKFFKSISNLKENSELDDYDFEIVKYKGNWGIINAAGEIIIPNDYAYIDFLRNPNYFKVGLGEIEIFDFEDENEYNRTAIKNIKWGIVDINNQVIVPIEYDWIDEVESMVWVVYKGGSVYYNDDYQEDYWTIKNGKLGVYNFNKLITPIEYDVIKKNWFRIKEYIFVQNGKEYFDDNSNDYDVYTLNGNQIKSNKPKPRDYTYYE